MIQKLLIASFLLMAQGPLFAQDHAKAESPRSATQIEGYLAAHHVQEKFSGAALIVDDGEMLYQGAFGMANADWQISNRVDTKFRLASISKQFTAMLTLLLVEEGKLDLNAPMTHYLSDYPAESGAQVTVHHLLNHTSGIPNYTNRPGFMQEDAMRRHVMDEFIVEYCSESLEFEPGTYFHYSNSGYYLLAAIIEKVTEQSYADALHERIFAPLGMHDTGHDDQNAVLQNRATGYHELLGKKRKSRSLDTTSFMGAGSLFSTVGDLWKWEQALRSKQLLKSELEKKMFTPGEGDYGYGWFIDSSNSAQPVAWHTGMISGFSTMILRSPKQGRCIILLCNTSESATQEIALGIMELLDGATPKEPTMNADRALARQVIDDGIEVGLERLASLEQAIREHRIEQGMNRFGYQLLGHGRVEDALLLLEFNTRAFPESANTWDSLGEIYLHQGKQERAIESYAKALSLNPDSTTARAMLREIAPSHPLSLQEGSIDPFKEWPSEVFALPPDFAPELPVGTESLRFAPGWRDPNSEEFWAYAFVMWMEEPAPDATRIGEILDHYYDGLMETFSQSAGKALGGNSVQVKVTLTSPGEFEAIMHLTDAFATFKPMDIRVLVSSTTDSENRTVLRVRLSPQAKEHPIWPLLETAVAGIRRP